MAWASSVTFRRAARAAVAIPLVNLLVVQAMGNPVAGFYAGFACLTMLIFADFGGPLGERFVVYLAAGAGGALAVMFGHVVSFNPWLAAVSGVAVGATLAYVTLLRGYVGAGASTVQLGFILAATAGPHVALTDQLLGWAAGALVASLSAVLLWPARGRSQARLAVASALSAAAALVRARWLGGQPELAARDLTEALNALRAQHEGKFTRPGAATSRDRAVLELIDELNRLDSLLTWGIDEPAASSAPRRALAQTVSDSLEVCAQCLSHGQPAPDPDLLSEAREAHMRASVEYAAEHLSDQNPAQLVAHVRTSFPLRLCAISAEYIANYTRSAVRLQRRAVRSAEGQRLPGSTWEAGPLELLRAHTTFDSPWFRNGLRAGLGLGAAILVALQLGAANGYWVVLGTLSMLRFDAMGTGRTAAQAVIGTAGGCLFAVAVLAAGGDSTTLLWVMLPIAVFAAGYTPSTTSYAIAQGAFSLALVIMSSLGSGAAPARAGLVRVTDIALGALVSVTVGALLWPRGARAQIRSTLATALDRGGAFALATTSRLASRLAGEADETDLSGLRRMAVLACGTADEAIDLAVAQRGPQPINAARWARGAAISHHLVEAADVMTALSVPPPVGPRTTTVGTALVALGGRTTADLVGLQAKLLAPTAGEPAGEAPAMPALADIVDGWVQALDAALLSSIARWPASDGQGAVRLVWAAQWQIYLAWLAACAQTVTETADAGTMAE